MTLLIRCCFLNFFEGPKYRRILFFICEISFSGRTFKFSIFLSCDKILSSSFHFVFQFDFVFYFHFLPLKQIITIQVLVKIIANDSVMKVSCENGCCSFSQNQMHCALVVCAFFLLTHCQIDIMQICPFLYIFFFASNKNKHNKKKHEYGQQQKRNLLR